MREQEGIEYEIHSMMVKAVSDMQPTKLEMLEWFESSVSGHIYSPAETNVRVVVTGRNWERKSLLIYDCKSAGEAEQYINEIIEEVRSIGHSAEKIGELEIANIAVNGDFHRSLIVENLVDDAAAKGLSVEYEPEQFLGAIIHLQEPSVTFLLFSTGKFVIQGAKDPCQIDPAILKIRQLLSDLSG